MAITAPQQTVKTMQVEYYLKNKRGNLVYVSSCYNNRAMDKTNVSLFVSMCGYGPLGRRSRDFYKKSLEQLENELSLFWQYPERKKDLMNLTVERYSHRTGKRTAVSMDKVVRQIEQKLIIKRLKA